MPFQLCVFQLAFAFPEHAETFFVCWARNTFGAFFLKTILLLFSATLLMLISMFTPSFGSLVFDSTTWCESIPCFAVADGGSTRDTFCFFFFNLLGSKVLLRREATKLVLLLMVCTLLAIEEASDDEVPSSPLVFFSSDELMMGGGGGKADTGA